jgi:hypothetical protein
VTGVQTCALPICAKLFVQGKNLVEKIENISLDDMQFSKDNPRISQHGQNLSQQEIQDILFEQEDGRTLKKQIFTDGQQYDEPYVRKEGSKYVVEEGNRRTTAMKSILADIRNQKITGVSEKEFSKIRCKILRPNATKAEIRKFLASIHISGKKDWPARNKGETISLMIDLDGETYLSIADHLGRSKNEIQPRTKRTDAHEDRDLADRDGRTRHIWILSNPREIKSTLN